MAKTKAGFLIGACCCGLISLALIVTSYATTNWISATIKSPTSSSSSDELSYVHHGLFTGAFERTVLGAAAYYNLYATCSFGNNACSWSCRDTEAERDDELNQLIEKGEGGFSCTPSVALKSHKLKAAEIDPDKFMQAGLWLTTILFLSISAALNLVALGSNIYNIFGNPIEVYASTEALPYYYVCSAFSTLMALILWGCQFSMYTSNNIAIVDTLIGDLESEANLDWSYYLLLPAEFGQLAAFNLIFVRKYLINKKESETVIKGDDVNHDANTFMY